MKTQAHITDPTLGPLPVSPQSLSNHLDPGLCQKEVRSSLWFLLGLFTQRAH